MRETANRFSQSIAAARPEMPLRAQLAACSWCPTEAATSASTAGAQADAPRSRHLIRPLADSWTLYDNTSATPRIIASEELYRRRILLEREVKRGEIWPF